MHRRSIIGANSASSRKQLVTKKPCIILATHNNGTSPTCVILTQFFLFLQNLNSLYFVNAYSMYVICNIYNSLVTCPALNLSNGVVSYNKPPFNNTEYVVGTVASFSCNIGYYISQNISRTCQLSGMWTQQTPICHISILFLCLKEIMLLTSFLLHTECRSSCNILTAEFCSYIHLPYGHVRYSQPAVKGKFPFHSAVAFWCKRGYRRVGEFGFFCGLNGWDGEVPDCVPSNEYNSDSEKLIQKLI